MEEAAVEARGLRHDRRWMLIDAAGRFLSQREEPRLALLCATITARGLALDAPQMTATEVPYPPNDADRQKIQIWKDELKAVRAGEAADAWCSTFLKRDVRLVFMANDVHRPVDPDFAVGDDEVSFADGYPLLLANEASLEALNERLDVPVPMNRFRPNVVVSGGEAFEEDTWRMIRIGAVAFFVVKPCARCRVTTVDQDTAETGKEPLRTLARFRRKNGKVYFGQNLIPAEPGVLHVGDPVEIVR